MDSSEPTVKFIRKRKAGAGARAKKTHSDSEGEGSGSAVQGSTAKRSVLLTTQSDAKDKTTQGKFAFAASGTAASLVVDTATRQIDVDGHEDAPKSDAATAEHNDALYAGANKYTEYVNKKVKNVTQSNAGGLRAGPLRAQKHVRISERFDYQQDICKDYKDSGTCGFGDGCIYMHDRSDYKTGWQIDKEWEEEQKAKKQAEEMNRFLIEQGGGAKQADSDEEDEDDVPLDCAICRGPFKDPIITKCKHYFCENCALKHFTKTPKCFECQEPTGGSFAAAKDLKAKLVEKRKKIADKEALIRKRVQEQMGEEEADVDAIKTRLQTQNKLVKGGEHYHSSFDAFMQILKKEGLAGLYSGMAGGLFGTVASAFSYFYVYSWVRARYTRLMPAGQEISTAAELLMGALAGAISQLFTLPIAVITTRQQTAIPSERESFFATFRSILAHEGPQGLWKGFKASMVLCSNPAITYGMFERVKAVWIKRKVARGDLGGMGKGEVFLVGALSKTLATVVTYPYIMAKVRMQWTPPKSLSALSEKDRESLRYTGSLDVLTKVLSTDGILGWYKGIQTQIVKAVLCQAILFVSREEFLKYTLLMLAVVSGEAGKVMNAVPVLKLVVRGERQKTAETTKRNTATQLLSFTKTPCLALVGN
ncbi:ADP/ATP carrier protein, partial [Podochytrium sp. JEL0797]